jgi:tripartite ATP-independent transporter DctM subunit
VAAGAGMSMAFAALLLIFAVSLVLRVPLAYGLICSGIVYVALAGQDLGNVAQVIASSLSSQFILVAIPMFIFTAQVMNHSTVSDRLFSFAHALVGGVRGGLAHVDVVASVVFSGMSGSAIADASGTGVMTTRQQIRGGYEPGFAAAATVASSIIGPIIPPSIPMVLYAFVTTTSTGMLFAAGVIPGLLLAAMLMALIAVLAARRQFPVPGWQGLPHLIVAFLRSVPALLTIVILLGGIYSGRFTPTEAAAVAALYAMLLAFVVYRAIGPREFWIVSKQIIRQTCSIAAIVAGALIVSYCFASEGLGRRMAATLTGITENPLALLLLVSGLMLVLGTFLDSTVILLVVVPVVFPAMMSAGVDPVHFGVVVVLNMMISLATPPVGVLLFIMSNALDIPVKSIIREIWPFLLVLVSVLLILILFPDLSLWLPRQIGYGG